MKRITNKWFLVVLIAVILLVVWALRFQGEEKVQFKFLGYEKDSKSIIRARFEMRNLSDQESLLPRMNLWAFSTGAEGGIG